MIKNLLKQIHPKYQSLFLEYQVQFEPRYGHGKPPHSGLYDLIESKKETFRENLKYSLTLKDKIWTILDHSEEKNQKNPTWNNGFLPGLDIIGIYSMISMHQPKKYLEVGSGNSTKVAYKAIQEQGLNTEIISIDPQPRAEIDSLADQVIRQPFESLDYSIIDVLEPGDILFIDNSHRILPNSDSMVFYLEVLPFLKKGVIVHIHDVYLPYDYPQFMCDRFYSEQYGLAMYMLGNPEKFVPILPNYFIFTDSGLSELISPIWDHENLKNVERHGGSFWLQIN